MKDVKVINIKMETEQLAQAKKAAHRREMTLSEYIRDLIATDLNPGGRFIVTPETIQSIDDLPHPADGQIVPVVTVKGQGNNG